jgi:pyrroline-5-carboxylate reductase
MKIAIIGAGTIGEAIARCLAEYDVIATRRETEKIGHLKGMGIEVSGDNVHASEKSDVIIICVKPNKIPHILKEIRQSVQNKIVISFAAAIQISLIKRMIPKAKVVRAMTNVGVIVREGFTVYATQDLSEEEERLVKELFGKMGEYEKVEEEHMDALTGLSGSGPAFFFTIMESLMYAGLKVGLPRDLALKAAIQTAIGSSRLISETGAHPSQLKDKVVTPGGTTIEGVFELEENKIRTALIKAVDAATKKAIIISSQLNKEFQE